MKRLLRLLRNGKGLRHLPVVYPDGLEKGVRLFLSGLDEKPIDVTYDHVPVSLRPLTLGIRLDRQSLPPHVTLEIYDALENTSPLARIGLDGVGGVPLAHGSLHLFHTASCDNRCVPARTRWIRYALSWQHARQAARRQDSLRMSAADLVCLNAYYIAPRPVFLVSVAHLGSDNLFPMDLVGSLSSGEFTLALRSTSPAIELMEGSRRLALCDAPAAHIKAIYALAAHHRRKSIDMDALPFPMRPSPVFGLPVIADAQLVREVAIQDVHRIGSHVLFISTIIQESGRAKDQLAHVSGMYAEWLSRHHRPLRAVGPL